LDFKKEFHNKRKFAHQSPWSVGLVAVSQLLFRQTHPIHGCLDKSVVFWFLASLFRIVLLTVAVGCKADTFHALDVGLDLLSSKVSC